MPAGYLRRYKCGWKCDNIPQSVESKIWARGYKKNFMLNSSEYNFFRLIINVKMPTIVGT